MDKPGSCVYNWVHRTVSGLVHGAPDLPKMRLMSLSLNRAARDLFSARAPGSREPFYAYYTVHLTPGSY